MSANRLDAKSRRKGVTKCQKREKSKIMISSIGNVNFFFLLDNNDVGTVHI